MSTPALTEKALANYEFMVALDTPYVRLKTVDFAVLVAEVRSFHAILSDLLLTRQAQEDARNAYNRLPDDACTAEYDEATERIGDAEKAYEEAWDRARSLLAGEAGNGN